MKTEKKNLHEFYDKVTFQSLSRRHTHTGQRECQCLGLNDGRD